VPTYEWLVEHGVIFIAEAPDNRGAGATGLRVADWQDVILVNQVGLRFYAETSGQFTSNNYNAIKDYKPRS
jgi:hypothetical protein